jgi:hypothetical protein
MEFEQMQSFIDRLDESNFLDQGVNGSDAAVDESTSAVGDFVVNVGGGVHRPLHSPKVMLVEPPLDASLAVGQLGSYLGTHSKSSGARDEWDCSHPQLPRKTPKDFELFYKSSPANLPGFALLRFSPSCMPKQVSLTNWRHCNGSA